MKTATTEIISTHQENVLELNYLCKTNQVIYSVADFAGNVLMRGHYDCLIGNKLSIETLPKGMFTLCIVDGDALIKTRFHKN